MAVVVDDPNRGSKGGGPVPGAPAAPLVVELRTLAVERLGDLLDRMLDGADDLLFEMSERAGSNAEVRVYFDTMRAIRLERARLSAAFRSGVAAAFAPEAAAEKPLPDEISIEELTLQDSRSVEQSIAISNMEAKAAGLYKQPLWELQRRLATLASIKKVPISTDALSPSSICRAFQQASNVIKLELDIELIVYKLFDRNVISKLGPLYTDTLALLERHGVDAKPTRFRPMPPKRVAPNRQVLDGVPGTDDAPLSSMPAFFDSPMRQPWNTSMPGGGAFTGTAEGAANSMPVGGGGIAAGGPAGVPLPPLDPQTFGMLQHVAGHAEVAPLRYSDANLAADLANAAQGRPVFGWGAPQAFAYAQRTSLIGRMFNELLNDPHLPEGVKPELDQLRFGVIKSALKDAGFFSDQGHPVRQLINELATIAATAKATDGDVNIVDRVRGLLGEVQRQIDEPPSAVRSAADGAVSVADELAEQFVEQQRQQSRSRRKAIIAKVREVVDAELRLRTAGMTIPEGAKQLLTSGWSTMMAYHMIRENRRGWTDGVDLLTRLTQGLDPELPTAREESVRAELRVDVSASLLGVGLLPERIEPMIDAYEASVAKLIEADVQLSESGAAAVKSLVSPEAAFAEKMVALLELLLVSGRWFHVFDRERKERRWLKLLRANGEGTTFTEFNGKNSLTMTPQETFEDLMSHRIEPIDAPPAARQMLDALIARRERG